MGDDLIWITRWCRIEVVVDEPQPDIVRRKVPATQGKHKWLGAVTSITKPQAVKIEGLGHEREYSPTIPAS